MNIITYLANYVITFNHRITSHREHLKEQKVEVVPTYKIAAKEAVKEGESPKWTAKKNLPAVSSSYHNYMVDCVIEDLMQHVLQVHDRPASDEDVSFIRFRNHQRYKLTCFTIII
jgi:hypothetical protein